MPSIVRRTSHDKIYQCQRKKCVRLNFFEIHPLPSDADAITILVELNKHPDSSPDGLAAILESKGKVVISEKSIERLLTHHGLKKTIKDIPKTF